MNGERQVEAGRVVGALNPALAESSPESLTQSRMAQHQLTTGRASMLPKAQGKGAAVRTVLSASGCACAYAWCTAKMGWIPRHKMHKNWATRLFGASSLAASSGAGKDATQREKPASHLGYVPPPDLSFQLGSPYARWRQEGSCLLLVMGKNR